MRIPFAHAALCALLTGGLALALALTATAGDEEIARQALIEGRIRPLTEIVEMLQPQFPGLTILSVEIEAEDDGQIVYEFDILDSSGRLKEVEIDAASGTILEVEDDD